MRAVLLVLFALVACGKGAKENRRICQQAADKLTTCVQDMLGPELAAEMRAKDGVDACAKDDKTVAMYRVCLAKQDCGELMDCMESYAREAQPEIPADKPRVEQCAKHVTDGLRGIAMQVVLLGEHAKRNAGDKEHAQRCTLDESKPWQSCLELAEIEEVHRYGKQRQHECEQWSPELAACILRLPGAKNCEPDEYPLWRLPLEQGPAGPRVAWTLPVADDDDYNDDVRVAWTDAGDLVVRDDSSLRLVRDGKPVWQASIASVDADFVLTGNWVVARGSDDTIRGLHMFDIASGREVTTLTGTYVARLGPAAGDRVLALHSRWDDDYNLVREVQELTPATCAASQPRSATPSASASASASAKPKAGKASAKHKTCGKSLASFPDDGSLDIDAMRTWRDLIVFGHGDGLFITDRRGKTRFAFWLDANDVVIRDEHAVLTDDSGILILSLSDCIAQGSELYLPSTVAMSGEPPDDCPSCERARGDCIVARKRVEWAMSVDPHLLADGTVAFNDHGITEKTHFFGRNHDGWAVQTNARGAVAGDGEHIYTVSMGLDGDGPFRLLALARDSGAVVWQRELAAKREVPSTVGITVRDGKIAVRIDDTIYVVELGRKT